MKIAAFVLLAMLSLASASCINAKEELILSGELKEGAREINVTAFQYGFSPDPIVVAKGEKVKLLLTSKDVRHGFALPEYNINVVVDPAKVTEVELSADKQGEFVARCSVYCGSGHGHMQVKLIVK